MSATARVTGHSRTTIARWLERAATAAACFNHRLLRDFDVIELQADERCTFIGSKRRTLWLFATIEVCSRVWAGSVLGRRSHRNTKAAINDVILRGRLVGCPLIATDGFEYYVGVMVRLLGSACVYGQVLKTRRNNRVVRVERRVKIGTASRLNAALLASEDSETLNTAFIERLNLTIRQGSAYLRRRSPCHARGADQLRGHVELLRCYYNFIRPHRALRFGRETRTPAMQAGLVSQCLGAQLAISVNNCPPPRDPRSRMTSFKRTQRKYVQKAYRVRNWRAYETGLRARGSLTVWLGLTDGKLANWNSPRPTRRKPGRQRQYSNHAIETTVTVGVVFGLASRQPEGFLRSLLTLLNLDNDVPDHSTISRRKARLGQGASYERRTVKPVHLRIDSSGLSVHVGQWRTPPQARDSRKLHLAVDEHTSDVVACELTSKRARDASRVASLVGQIERPIASAKADAAYDTGDV